MKHKAVRRISLVKENIFRMKGIVAMGLKSNFMIGLTAAFAATVIAPILNPVIRRAARALAKSMVRGGIMLYESGREAVARAGEAMEDMVAEVHAEGMANQSVPSESSHDDNMASRPDRAAQDTGDSGQPSDLKEQAYNPSVPEGRVA